MPQDLIKAARLLAGRKLEIEKSWVISDRQALKLTMELDYQPACGWVRAVALIQGLAPKLPTATHMQIPESVLDMSDEELGRALTNVFHDTFVPPNAMVALSLALMLNPIWVLCLTETLHKRKEPTPEDVEREQAVTSALQGVVRAFEGLLEEALTYEEVRESFASLMHEQNRVLHALSTEDDAPDVVMSLALASYFDEALTTLLSDVYVPLGYTVEGMPQFDNLVN